MRRESLRSVVGPSHAGLWLDAYANFSEWGTDEEKAAQAKANCIREACGVALPAGYDRAYARRLAAFQSLAEQGRARLWTATVRGRLAIGLGARGPLEVGVRLEHTWGMPYLPGSALKGLTASAAHLLVEDEAWHKPPGWPQWGGSEPPSAFERLFGSTGRRGSVVFHDAWWVPEPRGSGIGLSPDITTVHHREYYGGKRKAPTDFDSPVPAPFIAVIGSFLVCLEGTRDHLEEAEHLLKAGLEHLGLGAKTAAGYGRFDTVQSPEEREAEERARKTEEALARLGALKPTAGDLRHRIVELARLSQQGADRGGLATIARSWRAGLEGQVAKMRAGINEKSDPSWVEALRVFDELSTPADSRLGAPDVPQRVGSTQTNRVSTAAHAWIKSDAKRGREYVIVRFPDKDWKGAIDQEDAAESLRSWAKLRRESGIPDEQVVEVEVETNMKRNKLFRIANVAGDEGSGGKVGR